MSPRCFIRATVSGAADSRLKDGVASRAYARPAATLIGLLALIRP
jgi:hypothetical protein